MNATMAEKTETGCRLDAVCARLADALALPVVHVLAFAGALRKADMLPAAALLSVENAVDLLIALLASDLSDRAVERCRLYRAVPMVEVVVRLPNDQVVVLPAADVAITPGGGKKFSDVARSFGSALASYIRRRIAAEADLLPPRHIQVWRRSPAPLATLVSDEPGGEVTGVFRASGDMATDFVTADLRGLTMTAQIHGFVLDALAELFGAAAQASAKTAAAAALQEN